MRVRLLASGILAAALAMGAACRDGRPNTPEEGEETVVEPTAPTVAVQQIRSYPHDSTAFTQGLVWRGGRLYESTGRYGESSMRLVELETGRVIEKVDLADTYFAEGLAAVGDTLYQLTWKEGVAFKYDANTMRPAGQVSYTGEAWGLTTDGRRLIVSDGSSYLTFIDPQTFQIDTTVRVTNGGQAVDQLNELEWVRGEVWANVWHTQQIVRIDPATGRVKGMLDLSALIPPVSDPEGVLNGTAYDENTNRLLVTGKLWPRVYEISIPSLGIGGGGAAAAPAP
ncbi:MAG TPA: glutaminyl-peptide cyclotransferase [Longimicrobium sp.]|nr:glutaminyl-peptide cyclotransferase [Longimicrobium sp.]